MIVFLTTKVKPNTGERPDRGSIARYSPICWNLRLFADLATAHKKGRSVKDLPEPFAVGWDAVNAGWRPPAAFHRR
jgi:hypothetical protein